MAAWGEGTSRPLAIGLDCSTQSISAVVIDVVSRAVVYECALRFDDDLPTYKTSNGVRRDPHDPNVVLAPSLMLVDALDRILCELASSQQRATFKLHDVVCISGSAQQHTSAFWKRGFSLQQCMDTANTTCPLVDTIANAGAFARECGPSWMDSSTTSYCEQLEHALGGADRVARISGSRAYPRFTGSQIAKCLHQDAEFLSQTGRVSLASSLLSSLLIGDYAPIDASDASGMNLLDLETQQWSRALVEATAAQCTSGSDAAACLLELLGPRVVPSHAVVGVVHAFFQRKYRLRADCRVVAFSGDNPCTLAGVGLSRVGDISVSLGTSTTLMAVVEPLNTACARDEGHFFLNPIDPQTLMAMICYKNGALARENTKDQFANGQWSEFESLLSQTPVGNDGIVGFFLRDPEITPLTRMAGIVVFDANGNEIRDCQQILSARTTVRAIVESQCLSLRLHAERLGINSVTRLIATGGGAASGGFLQVLADVFGAPVLRLGSGVNSAALGGAFRAVHGLDCVSHASGFVPFDVRGALEFEEVAQPHTASVAVYNAVLPRFSELEKQMIEKLS